MHSSLQATAFIDSPTAKSTHTFYRYLTGALAFVVIVGWSGPSQANELWLWGWLGVAEIHIMQDASGGGSAGKAPVSPVATSIAKAVPLATSKLQPADASKKVGTVPKAQVDEIPHTKDPKDRPLKIIIM
jgi:hypothetical protein